MSGGNWWEEAPVVAAAPANASPSPDTEMRSGFPKANWWEEAPPVSANAAPVTASQAPTQPPTPDATFGEKVVDVAKSLPIGALKGILGVGSLPGNLEYLGRMGLDWAAQKIGFDDPGLSSPKDADSIYGGRSTIMPTYADYKRDLENTITGPLYEPKTVPGEYAQTLGEFLPGGLTRAPMTATQRATAVVAPAVTSETAGQLTKGTVFEPWARMAGALAPTMLSRTVTPNPIRDPEHAKAVKVLEGEGVALTAGQKTDNKRLKWAESVTNDTPFAGTKAADLLQKQGETFTKAALKRIGEDAPRATPEVMDKAFKRIGGVFEDVASRVPVEADRTLANGLRKAFTDYNSLVAESQRVPFIKDILVDIANYYRQGNGALSGAAYGDLRSRINANARKLARSDHNASEALFNIQNALDGAMQRSARRLGFPEDVARLRQARDQYRNILVVEKAAAGSGEMAAKGLISPTALKNATAAQSRRAYVRGKGDFAELARSGEAVMKALPQSGTAPRAQAMAAMNIILGLGGHQAGGPLGAIAGAAAPAIAARTLMSDKAQRYLGNQVMTPLRPYMKANPMSPFTFPSIIYQERKPGDE